ncbi:MAG: RND family transporter [Deinococcus sp.]|nr:RND family transporter [Deinococcus sp.]
MRWVAGVVSRFPWATMVVIGLITAFFASRAPGIKLDNDPENMIPPGHPARVANDRLEQVFGTSEAFVIGLVSPSSVFTPEGLGKVARLSQEVANLTLVTAADGAALAEVVANTTGSAHDLLVQAQEGGLTGRDRLIISRALGRLQDAHADPRLIAVLQDLQLKLRPIDDVTSLSTEDNIVGTDFGMEVIPLMETPPVDQAGADAVRDAVFRNADLFVGRLVSADGSAALVIAEPTFKSQARSDLALATYQRIRALADSLEGPEQVYISGLPALSGLFVQLMSRDMRQLTPLVLVVVLITLALSFRCFRGVMLPLLVVILSLIWTIGLMALLGRPITLIGTMMPTLLVAVGAAYAIHVVDEYLHLYAQTRSRPEAVKETMTRVGLPVFMAGLTTLIGFLTLAFSPIPPIREFGLFTAFGVLTAMAVSLTLVPAWLVLLPPPRNRLSRSGKSDLRQLLEKLGQLIIRWRWGVVAVALALLAGALYGTAQLRVDSSFIKYFRPHTELREADQILNQRLAGTTTLNIILDTGQPDELKSPALLSTIAGLEQHLRELPEVGDSLSLATLVQTMNRTMHGDQPEYDRLPNEVETITETRTVSQDGLPVTQERQVSGRDQIAQYLLLFESSGGDLARVTDPAFQQANVLFFLKSGSTATIQQVISATRRYLSANLPAGVTVSFAGGANLSLALNDLIVGGQLTSIITSALMVFLSIVIAYRSFSAGVFGIIPISLTVLLTFAALWISGAGLNIGTAMIANMAVGIGVDYAIHFISRYRAETAQGLSAAAATLATMRSTGQAITFNAVAVGAGFAVMLFSSFVPILTTGWLVALTMVITALGALTIVPALLNIVRPRLVPVSQAPRSQAAQEPTL